MQRIARLSRKNERRVQMLPISAIDVNPYQPRTDFDGEAVKALAASIASLGLLQPITVRPEPNGRYTLVAGERRLRACASLGMTTIEAMLIDAGDGEAALLALVENLQREDLHFLDEAAAYARVMRLCGFSQEALAARIGKTQGAIANKIRLLRLEAPVRDTVRTLALSERQARALLKLPPGGAQIEAAEMMASQNLNALRSEALVEEMLRALRAQNAPKQRMFVVVRDWRPYVNAIRGVVRQMQDAGLSVEMETEQPGAELLVRLRVSQGNVGSSATETPSGT